MSRPADRADHLHLEQFLPHRLSVLTNTVSAALAEEYSDRFDLSIPEWRVMAVLAHAPGLSAAEVAAHTAMDKVAISRAVARLMAAGRLRRRRTTGDRRRLALELSRAGRRVYGQIVPWALDYEHRLLAALTANGAATLDGTLTTLIERAHALRKSASP